MRWVGSIQLVDLANLDVASQSDTLSNTDRDIDIPAQNGDGTAPRVNFTATAASTMRLRAAILPGLASGRAEMCPSNVDRGRLNAHRDLFDVDRLQSALRLEAP